MKPNAGRFPLHFQILVAIALGLGLGPLLGKQAQPLGELGKLVIQLIKATATPLLFFSIVSAILKTEVRGRAALKLLYWASLNACLALLLGLFISNLLQPGRSLSGLHPSTTAAAATYASKKLDLLATLNGVVPASLVTPFAENLVLGVILLALLLGFGLRFVKSEQLAAGEANYLAIEGAVTTLLRVMEVVLGWVIRLIPLAIFGVVTRAVGEHGYAPLRGLAAYVAVGVGGLVLHVLVTYQCLLTWVARMPLRKFWAAAKEPVSYAAGANSSLATLPVTLRALDRLGVPRSASALGACVGTNFNNDGIILYEGMAVLFVAQAAGIELTFTQQLLAAAVCLIAAMGVAGVPEAGFVSLALVLNTVGLPLELLPLLLTVDWIIARGRSVVNVLSDMVLSILVAGQPKPEANTSASAVLQPSE
ncbi:MAG: Na+/H+ dicarboxylate symporter [Polyangiaceae bacterium]|jgi:DAACS family dicarboxylate/amino acid:cation (Na+ or H+) symporter|nr:Na+/H+ dicarboxylate symporter [Polyangiaceae bacterium]